MSRTDSSLDQSYFDQLYARDPDPWQFATSPYEDAKYTETLAILSHDRYRRALEVGCSIGELTFRLAGRCGGLEALDLAEAALNQARARNAQHSQVRFSRMAFPAEVPEGDFDLVVLSEVLYFLSGADLARAAELVRDRTIPGAEVLLVHWLGETPDFPSTGDQAADAFIAAVQPELPIVRQLRREHYRIDLLARRA